MVWQGVYNDENDQVYRPYYTGFPSAVKTQFATLVNNYAGLYVAYRDVSTAPRRGVLIETLFGDSNGNPTNSAWSGSTYSGYAYAPSVYDQYHTGTATYYGLSQKPINSWANTNTNVATFFQFLSHYYTGSHVMNKQPQFSENYYNNHDTNGCTGTNLVNTTTASINYDWGNNAPLPGVPADWFCVQWSGSAAFAADWYTFFMVADDGVKLLIDNTTILNKWFDQGPTLYYPIFMSHGQLYHLFR